MINRIEEIVTQKQEAVIKHLPSVIEQDACDRVDEYAQKVVQLIEAMSQGMMHTEPILREDFREAVKTMIKGDPGGVLLEQDEHEFAKKQAELFIDRAAEKYTDPDKYQPL